MEMSGNCQSQPGRSTSRLETRAEDPFSLAVVMSVPGRAPRHEDIRSRRKVLIRFAPSGGLWDADSEEGSQVKATTGLRKRFVLAARVSHGCRTIRHKVIYHTFCNLEHEWSQQTMRILPIKSGSRNLAPHIPFSPAATTLCRATLEILKVEGHTCLLCVVSGILLSFVAGLDTIKSSQPQKGGAGLLRSISALKGLLYPSLGAQVRPQ